MLPGFLTGFWLVDGKDEKDGMDWVDGMDGMDNVDGVDRGQGPG